MSWLHACRTPSDFRIWLRRIQHPGTEWKCCKCGYVWKLVRRNPTGRYSFWEWRR